MVGEKTAVWEGFESYPKCIFTGDAESRSKPCLKGKVGGLWPRVPSVSGPLGS